MKAFRNPITMVLVWCVRAYQTVISPFLPRVCKYYPSCSQYAIDALREYGAARGIVLAGWRLLRCNPLSRGGFDPVERQTIFAEPGKGEYGKGRAAWAAKRRRSPRACEPGRAG